MPEDLASEHMVRRAVDRLDADQLPGFIAECRERPLRAIAAHHHAIISGGEARNLQLVVALVAPEPGQAVIGLGVAGQPRRHAARVIGGVLHRLQPQRAAEARACEQRAVADRRDVGIRRQQLLVDDNAGRHRQAGLLGQFDIGQHADADHDQVGRHMTAVAEADAGHFCAVALDRGGLHAEMDANPRRGMTLLKVVRDFRGHRARHHPRAEFDHVDLEALGACGGGEFQPDESGADHDDMPRRRDPLPQRLAFIEDAQIAHVFEDWRWECRAGDCARRWPAPDARNREMSRMRARAGAPPDR